MALVESMKEFIHIEDAEKNVGEECALRGWVYRKRSSGGLIFIILRDSTGTMQAAVKKENVDEKMWKMAEDATIESSIELSGIVKADERSPTGYEMNVKSFNIIQLSEPFPITEYQSTELLLDKRHLWIRSQKMNKILRIRSYVFRYLRGFFADRGFYEVTPPLITKTGGESGSEMFDFDFFGDKVYLTQSSQLYLEAMIPSLEKVYCLVPSFRAEKSRTIKHLAEYWHLEVEAAYYTNEDNMKLQEEMVSYVCQQLAKNNSDLLGQLGVNADSLEEIKPPFKRLSYKEALDYLGSHGAKKKWLDDLGTEDERILTENEDKPIFVYNWPLKIKAFYMEANPENPELALNSDMEAPHGHGEIIGGSQRIWDANTLESRMIEMGLTDKSYDWYRDLRRYGSVPHSGFGFGVERFIKWILNLDNIRDATPFPRMINRAEP